MASSSNADPGGTWESEDQLQLFNKVKKDIRSLLLTAKHGRDLKQLEDDYMDINGRKLPLTELGLVSARQLLALMSDVCYKQKVNGAEVYRGISDHKTARIADLVNQQKENKTSRFGGVIPLELLQEKIKNNLLELLAKWKRKNGVAFYPLKKLPVDYQKLFREDVQAPRAFSCALPEAIERHMSDEIELHSSRQMIRIRPPTTAWNQGSQFVRSNLSMNEVPRQIQEQRKLMNSLGNTQTPSSVPFANRIGFQEAFTPTTPSASVSSSNWSATVQVPRTVAVKAVELGGQFPSLDEIMEKIIQIVQMHPQGLQSYEFVLKFFQEYNFNFDPQKLFGLSWLEFMEKHLGDKCKVTRGANVIRGNDMDWNISSITDDSVAYNKEDFMNDCRRLLANYPKGIAYHEFPVKFKELSGRSLSPLLCDDWWSVSDLVDSAKHLLRIERAIDGSAIMVKGVQQQPNTRGNISSLVYQMLIVAPNNAMSFYELLRRVNQTQDPGVSAMEFPELQKELLRHTDWFTFIRRPGKEMLVQLNPQAGEFPTPTQTPLPADDDPAKFGTVIERQPVPASPFEAVVTQFVKPDEFYVVLCSKVDEVASLMTEIKEYYDSGDTLDRLRISDAEFKAGLVCCAPWEEFGFHRVKVIEPHLPNDMMNVFFLEYGTTDKVHKSRARYLVHKFAKYPSQAFHLRLHNANPVGNKWDTTEAEKFFIEATKTGITVEVNKVLEDGSLSTNVWLEEGGDTLLTEYINRGFASPPEPAFAVQNQLNGPPQSSIVRPVGFSPLAAEHLTESQWASVSPAPAVAVRPESQGSTDSFASNLEAELARVDLGRMEQTQELKAEESFETVSSGKDTIKETTAPTEHPALAQFDSLVDNIMQGLKAGSFVPSAAADSVVWLEEMRKERSAQYREEMRGSLCSERLMARLTELSEMDKKIAALKELISQLASQSSDDEAPPSTPASSSTNVAGNSVSPPRQAVNRDVSQWRVSTASPSSSTNSASPGASSYSSPMSAAAPAFQPSSTGFPSYNTTALPMNYVAPMPLPPGYRAAIPAQYSAVVAQRPMLVPSGALNSQGLPIYQTQMPTNAYYTQPHQGNAYANWSTNGGQ